MCGLLPNAATVITYMSTVKGAMAGSIHSKSAAARASVECMRCNVQSTKANPVVEEEHLSLSAPLWLCGTAHYGSIITKLRYTIGI